MKSIIFQFLIALIISSIFIGCGKKSENLKYGVSIKAPKLNNSDSLSLSKESLNVLRISNNMNFILKNSLIQNIDDTLNYSFSSLGFIDNISSLEKSFADNFLLKYEIDNYEDFNSEISNIKSFISNIDSLIKLESQVIESQNNKKTEIKQGIAFPIFDENILRPKQKKFTSIRNEILRKEFFSLKTSMDIWNTPELTAIEIPIGNNNYSLLFVQPKNIDIIEYAKKFSEEDYLLIINNLKKEIISFSFPDISHEYKYELKLPNLSNDSILSSKITLNSSIKIVKPTRAAIKSQALSIENNLPKTTRTEIYNFNSPFLYIIRSRNSNGILYFGLFLE
ncbi:MAG: serpin family protein [Bacteroidales bacterium]